ncbi:fumarylacetoacetate hydrolase family protein [Burkholderia cenocepacia]|uniref:fumarylacetoacetate hydrolase family protein n=1 Tax=Burkholderia cenocepacia TaxID=95486 RepID=UPI001BA7EBAA|nr:fumarylacetoacetate hydrolase family protein [Burkholderia cenocepacia]QUN38671.1 fumarylacetoacetate hydrolase family protein [Burkholderia cenocepacia]QUO29425.1 fumarylacetoacetate hydrolase family protein [Burkholderia cenocepacia]
MSASHHRFRVATRDDGSRDGELVLVSPSLRRCVATPAIARTLQSALDDWNTVAPQLARVTQKLDASGWTSADAFDQTSCLAPLPRAYQWVDGSVYRNHARLMYRWRNEPIPPRYEDDPLVYQGGSDVMCGGAAPIDVLDETHDVDFEAEIGIVTTDVPMGVTAEQALDHIALVVLLNDVSLRALIPTELARGFGFYQSKPATSFAPVAVTPTALGDNWRDAMLHLPVRINLNGRHFGSPNAGEDTVFHFGHIIAHLARTRALGAGSIVGAGTISNADPGAGSACVTEARVRQAFDGVPEAQRQPYLRHGDRVRMEVIDGSGQSVFGAVDQVVTVRRCA